jgi:glycosyltransferase involved in cell wall biosynthesis
MRLRWQARQNNPGSVMKPTLKIAILVSGRQVASRERMFFEIAEQLQARCAQVEFLAAGPEPELNAAIPAHMSLRNVSPFPRRLAGIKIAHGVRIAASIVPLGRYLRRKQVDILFTTSIPPNIAGLLAARWSGWRGRIVLRQSNAVYSGAAPEFSHVDRHLRDRLIPRLYRHADAIIANSGGVAQNLIALGLDAKHITSIPNGVDYGWIADQAGEPPSWARPGRSHRPTIITIGRLVPQKDQACLLRAFALVAARVDADLLIVGTGPELPTLQQLARQYAIEDRVHFAGHQSNPYPLLARADLFVLSSRFEGMPNVLIEALACGMPVVSTDCPSGPREILADGAYGHLVPVGDAERLARAMERALKSPSEPERQRRRARAFDVADIARRYVDIILPPAQPAREPLPQAAE